MSRLNMGRYQPSRWTDPVEPVLPSERRAMRQELLVMLILVAIMLLATFAEPLMDVFMAALGAR